MAALSSSLTSPLSKSQNLSFTSKTASTTPTILNFLAKKPQNILKLNKSSKPSIFTTQLSRVSPNSRLPTIKSLFTGIVEEIGHVSDIGPTKDDGFDLKIAAKTVLGNTQLGDSIAVNGTCLTVTSFTDEEFTVGVSAETLRKTSLIELKPGSRVNLERAVLPTTRMGGHFVQGHVDGTGEIVSKEVEGDSLWIKVKVSEKLLRFIVPKGFIAVDGTSLTVVDVFDEESCFNFMLVAYTQDHVVIPLKGIGEKVNLEVDILGKYVERLLGSGFLESMKISA